jgi:GxxExxY protein
MSEDIFVDEEMQPDPELNRITNAIIGAAIEVHRRLGPGLLESLYENALAIEFAQRGIPFRRQVCINVTYKVHPIGDCRLDFLVDDKVLVELKAVETLASVHKAQVLCYLRITKHKLGLLINFNVPLLKEGIRRIAN